jgi:hypothetical protein
VFETLVSSVERELTIVEFGSFVHQHGTWVFSNFTGKAFSRVDFAEWYACPDGELSPGQVARDPRNWGGANQLRAGKMLWYYVGTDSNGNRFRGEAIIEQLSKLL